MDTRLGSGGQRLLQPRLRRVPPRAGVGLLRQRHAPRQQGPGAGAASGLPGSAWEDVGLCERAVPVRHQAAGMGGAPLRRGPQACQGRLGPTLPRPSGHPRLSGRPAARRTGAPPPWQAGLGEHLQGAAAGLGPAPSPLPQAAGQPNPLHLRPTGADAAAHRAVRPAAQARPQARAVHPHPALHPNRRPPSQGRRALEARLRQVQPPTRLAPRGRRSTGVSRRARRTQAPATRPDQPRRAAGPKRPAHLPPAKERQNAVL